MRKTLPPFVYLWFAADAVLALTPQVHTVASGGTPSVHGLPRVVAYLIGASAFTAASVVAAYLLDPARHT